MAAVILQGTLQIAKQQVGAAAAAAGVIQHAPFSSDVRVIKKPSLSSMRKGAGGRSSFNGVVATVFGSSGFLGRYVCNELGKHGTQLILPYRGDFYDMIRLKLVGDLGQVLFLPYQLKDEKSIRQAVKYSNVVINLVGRDWETKNYSFDDVNVHGARRLAKIAREEGVEKFIHVSALNCNPKPKPMMLLKGSGILRSKYYGEIAVREEFPDAVIVRPSIMFGSEDVFTRRYVDFWNRNFNHIPVYKKGLDTVKSPVYVADVASAIYEIIKNPDAAGQTYQAIGPQKYTLNDLVRWIMKESRRSEDEGYVISDARFDPMHIARALIFEQLPGAPIGMMHREIMEREATTDVVDYALPTLKDLGLTPSPLADHITWLIKPWRAHSYYTDVHGLFEKVEPPKPL